MESRGLTCKGSCQSGRISRTKHALHTLKLSGNVKSRAALCRDNGFRNASDSVCRGLVMTSRRHSFLVHSTADSSGMDSGSKDGLGIPGFRGIRRSKGNSSPNADSIDSSEDSWNEAPQSRQVESDLNEDNRFRGMVSTASQKLNTYLEDLETSPTGSNGESEWERWQQIMKEVDEKYRVLEALQFQMDDAVIKEDFKEAAKLKSAFDSCAKGDPLATSLAELERALQEENYKEAARIRDQTCTDLIGWWAGQAEDSKDDPFGRIVNISAMQGRLMAKSYTAKHLAAAREGSHIFDIFVDRSEDGTYRNQPVYLKKKPNPSVVHSSKALQSLQSDKNVRKPNGDLLGKNKGSAEPPSSTSEDASSTKSNNDDKDDEEEGLGKLLGFLKDTLTGSDHPMVINASDIGFTPDMVRKLHNLAKGDNEDKPGAESDDSINSTDDADSTDSTAVFEDGEVRATITVDVRVEGEGNSPYAGGAFSRAVPPSTVPAKIERTGRDEFFFHVESLAGASGEEDGESYFYKSGLDRLTENKVEIRTVIRGGPEGSEEETVSADQLPLKRENLDRLMKLALLQARRHSLTKTTKFRRIPLNQSRTDPFNGLYLGVYGAHNSEVVQLTRKTGKWEGDTSDSPPYEYVEAVKLTGDPNVPAGNVTFRAKIGRQHKLTSRGMIPEELGLTARYNGQGRLANPGFRNPTWVDGELLLFDGRAKDLLHGAEVGFIYTVAEKNVLVLFNQLNLKKP